MAINPNPSGPQGAATRGSWHGTRTWFDALVFMAATIMCNCVFWIYCLQVSSTYPAWWVQVVLPAILLGFVAMVTPHIRPVLERVMPAHCWIILPSIVSGFFAASLLMMQHLGQPSMALDREPMAFLCIAIPIYSLVQLGIDAVLLAER